MELIGKKDLMFGRKGFLAELFAGAAMNMLGINDVNRLYAAIRGSGGNCAADLLSILNTKYSVSGHDLSNIPADGGIVIISNHPTGGLDGVMLIDLLSGIRPDVKFMGNFLLDRIEPLSKYFIPVDPFNDSDPRKNIMGIRESIRHVRDGGALVIFPGGEVSSWQKGFRRIKDKQWGLSMIRLIRETGAPVIPVCIEARNSKKFYVLGKIHPLVRTALLPREFANKRNMSIPINIGSPVLPKRVEDLADLRVYGDYLRANVDYLHKKSPRRRIRIIKRTPPVRTIEQIEAPVEKEKLLREIDSIRESGLLLSQSGFDVFCTRPENIPSVMHEIGRLRETTFRMIGEGTMKSIDLDLFDRYYHQLFVWDREARTLVGAYRLGMGDEIMPRFGLKGFYVNSLFRMSEQMAPVMEKTIELGRSFVAEGYQRKPVSLLLLWKGILYVLLRNKQYRNLLGPVTISGEFDRTSKTIIMRYLQQHHFNDKLSRHVRPLTGIKGIVAPIDASLIEGVASIELINKLVMDIERNELSIPVLIKKYLQLNSTVLGFNVDHDFADGLDALMLLDLKKVPEKIISMLSKEISDIDVIGRFKQYE